METEKETPIATKAKKRKQDELSEIYDFEYTSDKEKFAKCKLCAAKNNFEKIIKMKDGNTSGIIRHLKNYHKEEYCKMYPEKKDQTLSGV